jgi:hypothetical protein
LIDWLARKRGCVVDFRLPGDLADIPSSVLIAREIEYLAQERARIASQNSGRDSRPPARRDRVDPPRPDRDGDHAERSPQVGLF